MSQASKRGHRRENVALSVGFFLYKYTECMGYGVWLPHLDFKDAWMNLRAVSDSDFSVLCRQEKLVIKTSCLTTHKTMHPKAQLGITTL